jgi:hypothetical protein
MKEGGRSMVTPAEWQGSDDGQRTIGWDVAKPEEMASARAEVRGLRGV